MLWIVFAIMSAAVALALIWPLSARRRTGGADGTPDIAFYRSQLAEVDDDIRRGLVASSEAETTRAEIARRLLASADAAAGERQASGTRGFRPRRLVAMIAAVALVPAFALALYLRVGAPEQPDMPIASRQAGGGFNLAAAIPKIEAHLAADPDDGRGFQVIAPIYLQLGRFDDAAHAYREALRLLGENAAERAALGQALVMAADGVVTSDARAAFAKALEDDPKLPEARFFEALATEQDGDKAKATTMFQALAAEAPPGAPWLAAVNQHLATLGAPPVAAPSSAAGVPSGPAAAGIADLPPEQRMAAIRGMVDGLAQRLTQNGRDPEGWLRLIRAYTVLGEQDKAEAAVVQARTGLAGDGAALAKVDDLARQLGLKG